MLISKKKWDGLQEQLSLLKTQVTHTGEEVSAQAADWSEKLNAMKSAVSRHETAMEDMLESWEEWQEKLEAQEARRAESEKNSATVFLRREKALVKLLTDYHDQLFALLQAAESTENATWSRQLSASMDKLSEGLVLAGIQVVGQPGAVFSYALHEAIDVVETADQALDMRVARVYSCGYINQGTVIRKAKTAVYQFREAHQ